MIEIKQILKTAPAVVILLQLSGIYYSRGSLLVSSKKL